MARAIGSKVKLSGSVDGLKAGYNNLEVKVTITKPFMFFMWIGTLIKINAFIIFKAFKSIN